MSSFGGTQASDEAQVNAPPDVVWPLLRRAINAHPSISKAVFQDAMMRGEFKTGMTGFTYGQNLSATVTPVGTGSRVAISGVAKWQTMGGRDQARVRKIAGELLQTVSRGLPVAETKSVGQQAPQSSSVADEIRKLGDLLRDGLIDQTEFDQQKKRLMS